MRLRKVAFIFSLPFIFLLANCGESPKKVEFKQLEHPNPTSYTFDIPLHKLHDTLIKIFDLDSQYGNPILGKIFYYKSSESDLDIHQVSFDPEVPDSAVFGKEYFQKPNTKNDIFLNQFDHWNSLIYHHKDKPFEYNATFAIQLKELNHDSTLLNIKALDPEIYNGSKCCGPCLGNYALTEKVKPTSIEEYTLILYIAQKLGAKGLQPLQLPK
jgi:hypothetical protein